jgi:hypothetical protein
VLDAAGEEHINGPLLDRHDGQLELVEGAERDNRYRSDGGLPSQAFAERSPRLCSAAR